MKKIYTFLLALLSISQVITPVNAENIKTLKPEVLSLQAAIETAEINNPEVIARKEKLNINDAEIVTASTIQNPSVITDYSYAENTYRAGIQGLLEVGNKRDLRVARAEARKKIVSGQINTLKLELRSNVRKAYTELFNLRQKEQKYQELLKINTDLLNISKKRESAGDIANLDTLQPEILLLNTQNELQNINYQITLTQNKLSSLMKKVLPLNIQLVEPGFVSGCLSEAVLKQKKLSLLIKMAYESRPEIKENLSGISLSKLEEDSARANNTPDFTVATGLAMVTDTNFRPGIFVTSSFPLLLFNRQEGPIMEAVAQQRQLEKEEESLKNKINLEVTNAFTSLMANRERIGNYEKEIIPKSLEIISKSQKSFEAGKSPVLIPLNAYQSYVNIQFLYLQSLLDYQNSITDLERAIGCV